jgi:hypothetical protein
VAGIDVAIASRPSRGLYGDGDFRVNTGRCVHIRGKSESQSSADSARFRNSSTRRERTGGMTFRQPGMFSAG